MRNNTVFYEVCLESSSGKNLLVGTRHWTRDAADAELSAMRRRFPEARIFVCSVVYWRFPGGSTQRRPIERFTGKDRLQVV